MENEFSREAVHLSEDGRRVAFLDQTALPGREVWREAEDCPGLCRAIRLLQVRGAPMIGIFAGYGYYVLARQASGLGREDFLARMARHKAELAAARPTAVNLSWALERMDRAARAAEGESVEETAARLKQECVAIHREEMDRCQRIAQLGLTLLQPGDGVLTHCNAGPIAASGLGTALGPILLGQRKGYGLHVYADETRPLLQGARLTAWELERAGVDVTLICDNMASMVMKNGQVQACLVGCDRIAANGDAANKIGTSGVAILARHYGIPFYVLGPTSTIDLSCPTGADIPIEERDGAEIREMWYSQPMAPAGVKCYNPAFDVTGHSLITAIVTEKGICREPFSRSLAELF